MRTGKFGRAPSSLEYKRFCEVGNDAGYSFILSVFCRILNDARLAVVK